MDLTIFFLMDVLFVEFIVLLLILVIFERRQVQNQQNIKKKGKNKHSPWNDASMEEIKNEANALVSAEQRAYEKQSPKYRRN